MRHPFRRDHLGPWKVGDPRQGRIILFGRDVNQFHAILLNQVIQIFRRAGLTSDTARIVAPRQQRYDPTFDPHDWSAFPSADAEWSCQNGHKRERNAMAGIRHIALTTENPSQTAEFYKQAFGLKELRPQP
jgi:hypothetical protein